MKQTSLRELTRKQQLMLAEVEVQHYWDTPWPWNPGRTQSSLLRRGLISRKELPGHRDFVALELTEEGKKVLAGRSPVGWVRYLSSHDHTALSVYFVQRLPLEELPEFLTHKSFGVRFFAMKRLRELTGD